MSSSSLSARHVAVDPSIAEFGHTLSPDYEPLRGVIYGVEQLRTHAAELARSTRLAEQPSRWGSRARQRQASQAFRDRFENNALLLQVAQRHLTAAIRNGENLTSDADWLLDNYYVVEEQLQQIRQDLPEGFFRELPKLVTGEPRVYALALDLLTHTDSAFDPPLLIAFLNEYQQTQPLTIGEVWAFPIMLRLGLLENLRRLAAQMLGRRHNRAMALRQFSDWQPDQPLPELFRSKEVAPGLVAQTFKSLPDIVAGAANVTLPLLERALNEQFPNARELIAEEHRRLATDQVSIGNVITSMRLVSTLDWVEFFEQTSLTERELRRDPAGVYPQMDLDSRNRYRDVIEDLSRNSPLTGHAAAAQAIALAKRAEVDAAQPTFRSHVGYWLVDQGRAELERAVGYKAPAERWLERFALAHPHLSFFGGMLALELVGLSGVAALAWEASHSPGWTALVTLLFFVPLSEIAVGVLNTFFTTRLPPRVLPKLELRDGIPENYRTLVVVPCMLSDEAEVDALVDRLESHYIGNTDPHLSFALLTDFPDSATEHTPADQPLVERAVRGIRRLNERYALTGRRPFHLLHRPRRWNPQEGVWMGWERKRGKITNLNQLVLGHGLAPFSVHEGSADDFATSPGQPAFPFVITLDADSRLPLGAARRLIAALAHPLNRGRMDPRRERVVRGFGLLQPRVSVPLVEGVRSRYAQIFANARGIDPYSTAASDLYHDLFGEGSFTGKGIYDVAIFERTLEGAFAENQILSHDLIEGCHARVGLLSDVEVLDGYPARYEADLRRHHRWVRGDWQIAPWLGPYVPSSTGWRRSRLSWLSWWKIFDNLRRSVVPPTLLIALIVAVLAIPQAALGWSLLALAVIGFPTVVTLARGAIDRSAKTVRGYLQRLGRQTALAGTQTLIGVMSLPHRAALMTDAIARTVWRMAVSHQHLLEWETAAAAEKRLGKAKVPLPRRLAPYAIFAMALVPLLPWPAGLAVVPWLLAWISLPWVAPWLNQSPVRPVRPLEATEQSFLRRVARDTWSYFELCVRPETHWLPPDNLQEYPKVQIAERISPTNEGLYLVSALAAHEFGIIGHTQLLTIWEQNLREWTQLEQLNGHFYNWYDTRTAKPLTPRYVSTVDSGNLAAALMVVQMGAADLRYAPVFHSARWTTLREQMAECIKVLPNIAEAPRAVWSAGDLHTLEEQLHAGSRLLEEVPTSWPALVHRLRWLEGLRLTVATKLQQIAETSDAQQLLVAPVESLCRQLDGLTSDYQTLIPWAECLISLVDGVSSSSDAALADACHALDGHLATELSLDQLCSRNNALRETCQRIESRLAAPELANDPQLAPRLGAIRSTMAELSERLDAACHTAEQLIRRAVAISRLAERLVTEMDFGFLYNPQRHLFAIGYNIEEERLDKSHYDMLCSEARLSSFLAVAKGDVPPKHWFQLGRRSTATAGTLGLLSWGGTMFEYLMPVLFQRLEPGSLLEQACHAALARQQEYGRQCGLPWGISESAYAAFASNTDYHYQSFGVPGLGLKRGLSEDLVIAPYATALAVPLAPHASISNLQRLEKEGARGVLGYYEAIDYTPLRVPPGKHSLPVRCYMAHHQAMSLLAIANQLLSQTVVRQFHEHPLVKATELLLLEGLATDPPLLQPHTDETLDVGVTQSRDPLVSRRIATYDAPVPRTHLLSNGSYSLLLTDSGSGPSWFGDLGVTRWQCDPTRDRGANYLYLRDVEAGEFWSATFQPTLQIPDRYEVTFSIDKAEYRRIDHQIESSLEVTVSPEQPAELRQLTLTNRDTRPRTIEVTSYVECTLAPPAADQAHPAFQKLFLETEALPDSAALLIKRRPRDTTQPPLWGYHALSGVGASDPTIDWETSRQLFLGRGRDPSFPAAIDTERGLSRTTGLVLDPVLSLRCRITLAPEASATIAFATGVAGTREEAVNAASQFHEHRIVQRTFELAWAFSQVQLQHLQLTAEKAQRYQQLATFLVFPQRFARRLDSTSGTLDVGRNRLWQIGVSGDRPIMLVMVNDAEEIDFVRDLIAATMYWERHGLAVDLVVVNDQPGSYFDSVQDELNRLIDGRPRQSSRTGSHTTVLRRAQISVESMAALRHAAHIVLLARQGWAGVPQAGQIRGPARRPLPPPRRSQGEGTDPASSSTFPLSTGQPSDGRQTLANSSPSQFPHPVRESLEFWNGHGGFAQDGREYWIRCLAHAPTPAPWSNVIANAQFGCLVTEAGGGYTWFENSREFKLTTWANDPVSDTPSECLYLSRDDGSLLTPLQPHLQGHDGWVCHGQGYSRFVSVAGTLSSEVTITIAEQEPVKLIRLKLHNGSKRPESLHVTYFAELVLGVSREGTQLHIVTDLDRPDATGGTSPVETPVLLAANPYQHETAPLTAFLVSSVPESQYSGDRLAFLGRHGSPAAPGALLSANWDARVGEGYDPCLIARSQVVVPAGETVELHFALGAGENRAHALELARRYHAPSVVAGAATATVESWDRLLDSVRVCTPNRALDLLVNRWLLYQTLSCRIWGRSAYYQSGGAYGFRDQLQDVMALVVSRPDLVREQILRAAARQYVEGDVQHWWHPPIGRGTRTRFSDDLLWLPLVTAYYVRWTNDHAILREVVPFLTSARLNADEHERYEEPQVAEERASLLEHCARAIDYGLRLGPHGLPLMGCGDWNDGMNLVGAHGTGESVWVGWLLLVLFEEMLPLLDEAHDAARINIYRAQGQALRAAIEQHAWDGRWYRRAYFDDGTPLGSATNDECQIDSIAQSWSVFAGAPADRATSAIDSVFERLVSTEHRLVQLFTPPFDRTELNPGYIKGYLPGVRENGGQYTHAVLWLIQALAQRGEGDRAMAIFDLINPITHARDRDGVQTYSVEPYVIAADVYMAAPHFGRGGWSWYTGSAGLTYRAALEAILGLRKEGDRVRFLPAVPRDWDEAQVELQVGGSRWTFTLQFDDAAASTDQTPATGGWIQLVDDGQPHHVTVPTPRNAAPSGSERTSPLTNPGDSAGIESLGTRALDTDQPQVTPSANNANEAEGSGAKNAVVDQP